MKDVMIRILATQSGDDPREQTELAEFSTEGQLDCLDGSGTLTYPESELTGMEGTGRMDFSPGERNTFLYETPYGSSTVGMETKRYASTLTERGGTLEIEYVIDFDHAFVALNQMHIQVMEKKEY